MTEKEARALGYNSVWDYEQAQKLRAQGKNETNNWMGDAAYKKQQEEAARKAAEQEAARKAAAAAAERQRQIDAYNQLLAYFTQQNDAARDSAIESINQRLAAIKAQYGNALNDVDAEYQKLINSSEVNRYRSRGALREALANRGQLDSGYGRQEALYQDVKYGNAVSNLLAERQKARNDINNLSLQAEAEAESDKANVKTQFANALAQWKANNNPY